MEETGLKERCLGPQLWEIVYDETGATGEGEGSESKTASRPFESILRGNETTGCMAGQTYCLPFILKQGKLY